MEKRDVAVMDYSAARRLVGEELARIESSIEPLGEWDQIFERLRRRGLARLSIGQQIRVGRLFARLAQDGNDLSDKAAIADYLVSILTSNAQEARIVRSELGVAQRNEPPPPPPPPERRRLLLVGAAAIGIGAAGLGYFLYQLWVPDASIPEPQQPQPQPERPQQQTDTTTSRQILALFARLAATLPSDLTAQLSHVAIGLVLSAPIILAIASLLVLRHQRRETILRGYGQSGAPRELKVPPARALLDDNATQRITHALQDWQHLRSVESIEIDVTETIRYAARNCGRPEWHYQTRRSRPLYVLLVDRGVAGDHMGLIAHTIEERLKAAGLVFERYDFTEDPRRLWNAGSLARLTPPESLSNVAARHRGERLLLLSDGEAFGGPVWEEFADLITLFSRAVLIDPTPEYRWGERQEAMAETGLLVVPLSPEGFVRAISAFGEGAEDARAEVASGIGEEIDPFLLQLRRERGRYLADIAPEEDRTRRLIRQIRNYLSRDDLYELFVAIAAFPKIAPSVTLYLAEALRGQPIDLRQAGLLARLPWLRVVMLKAVPNATEQTLPDPREIHEATKITVVTKPNFLDALRGRHGGAFGEHIFIGFMKREPLSIDAPDTPGRPWWRRLDWLDYLAMAAVPLVAMAIIVLEPQLIDVRERLISGGQLISVQLCLAAVTAALLGLRLLLQSGATRLDMPATRLLSGPALIAALAVTAVWSSLVATTHIDLAVAGLLLCGFGGATVLAAVPSTKSDRTGQTPYVWWLLPQIGSAFYGFYCLAVALGIPAFVGSSQTHFSQIWIVLAWPVIIVMINRTISTMLLRRAERWIFAPIASFTSLPGTMWGSWMALAVLLENSWRVLEMNTRYGIELQEALLISFLFIFYLEQRFGLTPANPAPQVGALKLETLQFLAFAIDVLIHYVASRLFGLSFDGELALAPLVFLFLLRAMLETANPSWTIFERVLSFVGNLRFNVLLLAATLYAVLSAYGDRIVREVLERPRPSGTGISSSILEIQFAVMPAFVMAIFFSMSLAFCSLIFQQMTSSSDERWSFGNIASDAFRLLKWVAPRILVAGIVIFWVAAWQMSLTWMLPPLALASWWLGRSARFVFIGAGLLAVATSSFLALILADLKYLPSTTNNHDYAGGAWCIAALYFWMRYIDDGDFRRRALAMSQVSWLELALIAVALAPVAFLKSGRGDVSIDPLPMLMSVLVIAGLSNMPLSRPLALIAMLFAIWVGTSATGLQSRDVFWLTFGINPGQGFAALLALLSPRVVQFIVLRQQSNPSWQDHPQNSYSTRAFITFAMALVAICASHEPYLAAPTAIFITMSAFTIELGLLLAFFAGFVSGQMRFGTLVFTAAPPLAFAAAPSSIGLAAYVSDGATIVANSLACLAWFALGIATRRITTYGSLRLPGTTGENTASKSTSEVS